MKVAILDSGISNRNREGCNNVESYYEDDGIDKFGHGDYVFQIIKRISGENTEIDIVKILDDRGRGSIEGIIDGLMYSLENDINIINLSLSFAEEVEFAKRVLLQDIITELLFQKKYIICAAENKKYDEKSIPASIDGVYGVYGALIQNEKGYYYDKKRKIQILGNATPVIVYDAKGNRKLFRGNSKATAIISALAVKYMKNNKNDLETILQQNAISCCWKTSEIEKIESWTLKQERPDCYRSEGKEIYSMIEEYKLKHKITGSVLSKKIMIDGVVCNNYHFLDIISFIEKQLGVIFLNDSIKMTDFRNEDVMVEAILNRWKKFE